MESKNASAASEPISTDAATEIPGESEETKNEILARPSQNKSGTSGFPNPGFGGPLRVLRHREFALFWGGQAISLVGTWMQGFAQGWVVAEITTSALALGLINFAMSLPTLILMPFGGVAADRFDRRAILIYTQWVMLALALVMGLLIAGGKLQLWHIHVVALLLGVATAYDLPAYQSFYPQLIEKEELPSAISLNQATFHASRIVGPALASWLVARWGTASAFYANALTFLAVIVSLWMIRRRPPAAGSGKSSVSNMMREGFRYVGERKDLQVLLGITALTTLFIFPNLAVLSPYYIKHVLGQGPGALGILMSLSGAGALLGAAVLLTVRREQRLACIVGGAITIMLTMSVLAWAQHLWLAVAAAAVQSLAIALSLGISSIMIQESVPDELRGRVMSLYSLTFTGIMPFGALLIPAVADSIGMRPELQGAGLLYGLTALALVARLKTIQSA